MLINKYAKLYVLCFLVSCSKIEDSPLILPPHFHEVPNATQTLKQRDEDIKRAESKKDLNDLKLKDNL